MDATLLLTKSVLAGDRPLAEVTTERLEAEIAGVAASIAATTCRWLGLVAEYDRRKGWEPWECRSMAHWLVGHVGMGRSTAREHVRVANALTGLPLLRAEFEAGRLSYSRVRTVSRVATAQNEKSLVGFALAATAPQLERWATAIERATLAVDPDAAERIFELRSVTFARDENGGWVGRLRLPPEVGALLAGLIQEEIEASPHEDDEDKRRTIEQRRADAFAALLERLTSYDDAVDAAANTDTRNDAASDDEIATAIDTGLRSDNGDAHADDLPDRIQQSGTEQSGTEQSGTDESGAERGEAHQAGAAAGPADDRHRNPRPRRATSTTKRRPVVVVHRYPDGAELNRMAIPVTTAERLACDCFTVPLDHDNEGNPLNYGRTRRTPTTAQRRAVTERDQSCRFPGCGSRRDLHTHHVAWWTRDLGPTDLNNLVSLCGRHHRVVHDRHWKVLGTPDGHVEFVPPDRTGPIQPVRMNVDDFIASFTDPLGPIRPTAGAGDHFHLADAVWTYFHNDHIANLPTKRQPPQPATESASAEAPRPSAPPAE